jgi:hypothetical protein
MKSAWVINKNGRIDSLARPTTSIGQRRSQKTKTAPAGGFCFKR